MKWLFAQGWLLMLLSVFASALLTWLFLVRPRSRTATTSDHVTRSAKAGSGEGTMGETAAAGTAARPAILGTTADDVTAGSTVDGVGSTTDATATADKAMPAASAVGPATDDGAAANDAEDAEDPSAPHSAMQGLTPSPAVAAVVAGGAREPHGPGSAPPRPDGARDAEHAGFTAWNERRPEPRVVIPPTFEEGPYPGSAVPASGGAAPSEEFTVKGTEDSKLYHTKESPFYGVTRAEVWFRNEADAQRAGFSAWRTVRQG